MEKSLLTLKINGLPEDALHNSLKQLDSAKENLKSILLENQHELEYYTEKIIELLHRHEALLNNSEFTFSPVDAPAPKAKAKQVQCFHNIIQGLHAYCKTLWGEYSKLAKLLFTVKERGEVGSEQYQNIAFLKEKLSGIEALIYYAMEIEEEMRPMVCGLVDTRPPFIFKKKEQP